MVLHNIYNSVVLDSATNKTKPQSDGLFIRMYRYTRHNLKGRYAIAYSDEQITDTLTFRRTSRSSSVVYPDSMDS